MLQHLLLGLGLGALTGWVGYRSRFLSLSGLIGVILASTLVFVTAGWVFGGMVILSVSSSNAWASFRDRRQAGAAPTHQRKPQGWAQIIARLGWGVAIALLYAWGARHIGLLAAFVGSIATENADSWATEIGMLDPLAPRLITTRLRVPAGTAGGITVFGIVAAVGASWLIGLGGLVLTAIQSWLDKLVWDRALLWLPLAAMIGGVAGCLIDSLLGATAQGVYYCEHCDARTEEYIHDCGRVAKQIRGWSWLTNDGVDLVSSVVGAAVTTGALAWLAQTNMRW